MFPDKTLGVMQACTKEDSRCW